MKTDLLYPLKVTLQTGHLGSLIVVSQNKDIMKIILFTLFLGLSLNAIANIETRPDEGGWINKDSTRAPNSDSMKSINGFGGWLVVTPDKDWAQKWETPTENIPYFSEANEVKYGEELTILPFFINPKADSAGEINIFCHIKITKPTGKASIDQGNIPCANSKLYGDPRNIRLTTTIIKYIGENNDPSGTWLVEFTIFDKNRNTSIPLKTQFTLIK